jgi:hypothetical protein
MSSSTPGFAFADFGVEVESRMPVGGGLGSGAKAQAQGEWYDVISLTMYMDHE